MLILKKSAEGHSLTALINRQLQGNYKIALESWTIKLYSDETCIEHFIHSLRFLILLNIIGFLVLVVSKCSMKCRHIPKYTFFVCLHVRKNIWLMIYLCVLCSVYKYWFILIVLFLCLNSILEEHVPLLGRTYTTNPPFQLLKPITDLMSDNDDKSYSAEHWTFLLCSDIPNMIITK